MQTERIINQRVEQNMFQEKDKMRQMEQRIIFLEGELQVIQRKLIIKSYFQREEIIKYML